MKVQLSVSCSDLGQSVRGVNGAVVALFEKNPLTGLFDYLGQTEWIRDTNQPKFHNKLVFQYYGKGQSYTGAGANNSDSEVDGGASSGASGASGGSGTTGGKRSSDNELKFAVYVISANQTKLSDALATAKASMETLVQFLDDDYAIPLKETEQHKEASQHRLPATAKINFAVTRVEEEDDKEIADLAKQTTAMMTAGRTFVQYTAWSIDQPNVVNLFYKPPKTQKEKDALKAAAAAATDGKGPAPPSTSTAAAGSSASTVSAPGANASAIASPSVGGSGTTGSGAAGGSTGSGSGLGTLYWCEVGKRDETRDRSIPLVAVTDVMIGKKTDVFKKPKNRHARLDQCFSILWKVVPKAERDRWEAERAAVTASAAAATATGGAIGPGLVANGAAPDHKYASVGSMLELPGEMHELNVEAESNEIRDAWVFGLMNICGPAVRFHHAQTRKDREEEEARKKEEDDAQREREFRERALKSQADQLAGGTKPTKFKSGQSASAPPGTSIGGGTTATVEELMAALADGSGVGADGKVIGRDASVSVSTSRGMTMTLSGRRTQKKVDFQLERLSIILPNAVMPYNLPTKGNRKQLQSQPRKSSLSAPMGESGGIPGFTAAKTTPNTPQHTPAGSRPTSPHTTARGKSSGGDDSDTSDAEPKSEKEPPSESEKEPASESETEAKLRAQRSMQGSAAAAGARGRASTSGSGSGGGDSDSDDTDSDDTDKDDDEDDDGGGPHGKLDAKQQKIQVSEALRNTLLEGRAFLMYTPWDDKPQIVSLWMQKVDLPAKTKPRYFMFWEPGTEVLAKVPMLRTVSDRRALPLSAITNIILGKRTPGLRHRKNVVDDQCFALASAAGEWEFEAETPELRDMFVMALRYAATVSNKEPRIISDAVRPSIVALGDAQRRIARIGRLAERKGRGEKLTDKELKELEEGGSAVMPKKWKIHMNHVELKNLAQLDAKERALCRFDDGASFIVAVHQQIGDPEVATYELVATTEWLRNEPLPVFAKKLVLTYTEPSEPDPDKAQHNLRFSVYNFPTGGAAVPASMDVRRPCYTDFEPPFHSSHLIAVTDPVDVGRVLRQAKRMTHFFGLVCTDESDPIQNVFDDRAVRLEVYVDNIALVPPPGVSMTDEKQQAAAAAAGIVDSAAGAVPRSSAGAGEAKHSDDDDGGYGGPMGGRTKSLRKLPIGRGPAGSGDADMSRVIERAKTVLRRGAPFRLHFSSRQPFHRFVFYEERKTLDVPTRLEGVLYWCEPGKRLTSIPSSIPLTSVIGVYLGKHARVFPKADGDESAAAKDDHCFSIIAQDKQLHLEAASPEARDAWAFGFVCLLRPLKKKLIGWDTGVSKPEKPLVRAAPAPAPPKPKAAAPAPVAAPAKSADPIPSEPAVEDKHPEPVTAIGGPSSAVNSEEYAKLQALYKDEAQKYRNIFAEHSECSRTLKHLSTELHREHSRAENHRGEEQYWKAEAEQLGAQLVDTENKLKASDEYVMQLREADRLHTDQLAQSEAMLQATRANESRLAAENDKLRQMLADSEHARAKTDADYAALAAQLNALAAVIAAAPAPGPQAPAAAVPAGPDPVMSGPPQPEEAAGPFRLDEDKTTAVLPRPPKHGQVLNGWALPAAAVDYTTTDGSIPTAADDLWFGEVWSGIALPYAADGTDAAFLAANGSKAVVELKPVVAPVAKAAPVAAAPAPPKRRGPSSGVADAENDGGGDRHTISSEERRRRNEEDSRLRAQVARLSADNDRMSADIVSLKTEVQSYRALESVVAPAAAALVKHAQAAALPARKLEERTCAESLVRLRLVPEEAVAAVLAAAADAKKPGDAKDADAAAAAAAAAPSAADDAAEKKRKHELKRRADEEDIRPEQPLALRVNKCVRLAGRLADELEESRARFALAFANIENGVRADIESTVRSALGPRFDEIELHAKQFRDTQGELEALRAERKHVDDQLAEAKTELSDLRALTEKMGADEQAKLEILVTQLTEARDDADRARTALARYEADPAFAAAVAAAQAAGTSTELLSGRPSIFGKGTAAADGDAKDGDGKSAADGDAKDSKSGDGAATGSSSRRGSATGAAALAADKRRSFSLPQSSPLLGNETHAVLKQKVVELHNALADKDLLIESLATMREDDKKQLLKVQGDLDDTASKYERVSAELSVADGKLDAVMNGGDLTDAQKEAMAGAQGKLVDELKAAVSRLEQRVEEKDRALADATQTKSFMEVQLKDGQEQLADMRQRLEEAGLKTDKKKAYQPTDDEWKGWQAKAADLDACRAAIDRLVTAYEAANPTFAAAQAAAREAALATATAAAAAQGSTPASGPAAAADASTDTKAADGAEPSPAPVVVPLPAPEARAAAVIEDLTRRTSDLQTAIDALNAKLAEAATGAATAATDLATARADLQAANAKADAAAAAGPALSAGSVAIDEKALAELKAAAAEFEATKADLQRAKDAAAAAAVAAASMGGAADDWQKEKSEALARVAALTKQVDEEKELLRMRDDTLEAKDQLLGALRGELATKDSLLRTYETTTTDAQADADRKTQTIAALEAKLAAATAAGAAAGATTASVLPTDVREWEQKVGALEKRVDDLTAANELLTKSKAELLAAGAGVSAGSDGSDEKKWRSQVDALREQLATATANATSAQTARDDLQAQLTATKQALQALGSGDRDFKSLMDEKIRVQTEYEALKLASARDSEEKKSLAVQVFTLKQDLDKARAGSGRDGAADGLADKVSSLTVALATASAELGKRQTELEQLRAQARTEAGSTTLAPAGVVGEYKRQVDDLTRALADAKVTAADHAAKADAHRATIDTLKHEHGAAVADLTAKHGAALDDAVKARDALAAQNDVLQREKNAASAGGLTARELDAALKAATAAKAELDTRHAELESTLRKVSAERDEFLKQNKSLRADADANAKDLAARTKERDDVAAQNALQHKFSAQDEAQFALLAADKQRLTDDLAARDQELLALRDKQRAAEVAKADAEKAVAKRDADLSKLRADHEDDARNAKAVADKLERANVRIEELSKQLKAFESKEQAAQATPAIGSQLRSARGSIMLPGGLPAGLVSPQQASADAKKWADEKAVLVEKLNLLQDQVRSSGAGGAGAAGAGGVSAAALKKQKDDLQLSLNRVTAELAREKALRERAQASLSKFSLNVVKNMEKKMERVVKTGTIAEMGVQLQSMRDEMARQAADAKLEQDTHEQEEAEKLKAAVAAAEHEHASSSAAAAATAADAATAAAATASADAPAVDASATAAVAAAAPPSTPVKDA